MRCGPFGIAPAGLFFMFIITYAVAAADIAKLGAVVKRGRSVEALANGRQDYNIQPMPSYLSQTSGNPKY